MAWVTTPYNFTNGTTADADQVDANFTAITAQVNGNLDLSNLASTALQKTLVIGSSVTHSGALPYTVSFTLPVAISGGLLHVSTTAYSPAAASTLVAVATGIDGSLTTQMKAYAANAGVHMTLNPAVISVGALASGAHTLGFRNDFNAAVDGNDFWTAYLFYYGVA